MDAVEVQYDGLIGPTHNYGGLSPGNLASETNREKPSNPRAAALQGLAKMRRLMGLGMVQAVLPPHERPNVPFLRECGFTGTDAETIEAAAKSAPEILAAASSASAMWAANAATISHSADSDDARVQITPANLLAMSHRAQEAAFTSQLMKTLFPDPAQFRHHAPLPHCGLLGDEGAANHMRFAPAHGAPGFEVFVYGRDGTTDPHGDGVHPRRQTRQAAEALARRHDLPESRALLLPQSPTAIDAGAFHNDVVAVSERNVLFAHEEAFVDPEAFAEIGRRAEETGFAVQIVKVASADVSLADAVESYLFNSQLVTRPNGRVALVVPSETEENPRTQAVLAGLASESGPIHEVHVVDVRQSMRNGGGPACLRLRIVLSDGERAAAHQGVMLDKSRLTRLEDWVSRRYRDRLTPEDLGDPALLVEGREALDELTQILDLPGGFYVFQRDGGIAATPRKVEMAD